MANPGHVDCDKTEKGGVITLPYGIRYWFKANKLSVNESKTNYMLLGTPHMVSSNKKEDFDVILNDTKLTRVSKT